MEEGKVKVEWIEKSGKQCLKFTFGERLTTKEAEDAITEWRKAFQTKGGESIVLIWDCRKMKGYDSAARVKWTGALKEMKSHIDTIWLISGSAIVKMGASAMSMFTSLNINNVNDERDIII